MTTSFWRGKNVFVTGVNGFIGGNLVKILVNDGATVTGLIRNQKKDTLLYYEKIDERMNLIQGELTDLDLLSRIIAEEAIDVVFHLGAQVEVGVALTNPYMTYETNTRGTYTLMEACRVYGQNIKAIVIASTDKSYGSYPKEKMPYKEDYPLCPKYPYDVSKAAADMIAQSYANDVYKMPVVVTRFCNIYGPGQLNFSAVMPDAIRSALKYSTFIPRGNGQHIRDFIFAEDVVGLYERIAEGLWQNPAEFRGHIFNAGTNSPITVKEIVTKIYQQIGNTQDLKKVLAQMEGKKTVGEIDVQFMDFEKVNKFFGWKPENDVDVGIQKTIKWFEGYLKWKNQA
jgi:CDP-glucose 4,6-dehydratase